MTFGLWVCVHVMMWLVIVLLCCEFCLGGGSINVGMECGNTVELRMELIRELQKKKKNKLYEKETFSGSSCFRGENLHVCLVFYSSLSLHQDQLQRRVKLIHR